jgi:hypothetical protein
MNSTQVGVFEKTYQVGFTGFLFFIGICLSIISIKDVSNFEYALFTSSSAIKKLIKIGKHTENKGTL